MDEIEKYRKNLRARIEQLIDRIDNGEATRDFVAFETLWSLFSAFEADYDHDAIKDAYPFESWRDDTVTLPRAIVRRLADGWEEYRSSDASTTLGNAFKLEGGQGRSPIIKTNKTLDAEHRRSNEVVIEKLLAEKTNQPFKLEAAYFRVAEVEALRTGKKVSPDTVKSAFKKHGKRSLKKYRLKHQDVSNPTS